MTLGEDRVRVTFNPNNNNLVDQIKQETAKLIDLCQACRAGPDVNGEVNRLLALAQTYYETAGMFAVKAVTA